MTATRPGTTEVRIRCEDPATAGRYAAWLLREGVDTDTDDNEVVLDLPPNTAVRTPTGWDLDQIQFWVEPYSHAPPPGDHWGVREWTWPATWVARDDIVWFTDDRPEAVARCNELNRGH